VRLAWFSPWPPDPSGVAGRSAELVAALAADRHAVSVFVDETRLPVSRAPADPPRPGTWRVESAHDFVWRVSQHQFDLVVYQIGNSRLHEFIWPYAFRWPGLAVLHDARLHHARGHARLARHDAAGYRTEFTWSHPDVSPEAAELAVAGFDGPYYYLWPMLRPIVEASRMVATHSPLAAADIRQRWPSTPVASIALGEGRPDPISPAERTAARARLGFAPTHVVFGVFGALSAEKRVAEVVRAFRRTHARQPDTRLLLSGDRRARALDMTIPDDGETAGIRVVDHLDDAAFDEAIAAVDVSVNLRWPSAIEMSGPWLRALAAGRATIMTDLEHLLDVPTIDPRHWRPNAPRAGAPVAVAIDILDEDHSLALAMRRLASDVDLRDALGRAGRAYWERTHTFGHMLDDYRGVLQRAMEAPMPAAPGPPALRRDPAQEIERVLEGFGEVSCRLF
jgi:glycosyltransferase involved in cell wall biosynthesis